MNKRITISILIVIIAIITILILNKEGSYNNISTSSSTDNTVKSYTLSEVATHATSTDCWTVIEGNVINPTQFIAEGKHPNDFILKSCGIDATEFFKKIPKHAGPTPQEALGKYKIGVLK